MTLLAIILRSPLLLFLLFVLSLIPMVIARPPLHLCKTIIILYILIFSGTIISQGFFHTGSVSAPPLFWLIPPTLPVIGPFTGGVGFRMEGAVYGFIQAFRILSMLNASIVLVITTQLNKMIAGLKELGVPYLIVFMITTAVRFVPTIIEEFHMINNALKARGIGNSLIKRVEYSITPLILNSIRRCSQLALAAESRAFGSTEQRTYYTDIRFSNLDIAFFSVATVSSLLFIISEYFLVWRG